MKIKRIIVYILAVLSLTACAPVPAGEEVEVNGKTYYREEGKYYFRDSIWGMKPKDIVILEGREPDDIVDLDSAGLLMKYNNFEVTGMTAEATYHFDGNELFVCSYDFDITHDGRYLYYYDFLAISEALTELYGEPTEKIETVPEEYKDKELAESRKDWPTGELVCIHRWESNDTTISLDVVGTPGNEAVLWLTYSDTPTLEAVNKAFEEQQQKETERKQKQQEKEAEEINKLNRRDEGGGL